MAAFPKHSFRTRAALYSVQAVNIAFMECMQKMFQSGCWAHVHDQRSICLFASYMLWVCAIFLRGARTPEKKATSFRAYVLQATSTRRNEEGTNKPVSQSTNEDTKRQRDNDTKIQRDEPTTRRAINQPTNHPASQPSKHASTQARKRAGEQASHSAGRPAS